MRIHLFFIALILMVGILSYANSLHGEFVFDDITGIVQKKAVHDVADIPAVWEAGHSRFLANLSFSANYSLGGRNVVGYHVVNIIIHLINGVLVYWFVYLLSSPRVRNERRGDPERAYNNPTGLRRLAPRNDSILIPLLVALLFISHPIQTQAVAYISQRTTSLAALWYLLSMISWMAYLGARYSVGAQARLLAFTCLFAVCAFLTKEYTYTLPLVAGLLVFFVGNTQTPIRVRWWAAGGLSVMAVMTFLVTRTVILEHPVRGLQQAVSLPSYTQNAVSRQDYAITQLPVAVIYLRLLLWPAQQSLDHDIVPYRSLIHPHVSGSLLLLAALAFVALWFRRAHPLVSFGVFFFFATLAAESSIVPITDVLMEHRLYLPSVGFFLAITAGIRLLFRRYSIRPALYWTFMLTVITACSLLTYRRNSVWQNGIALWHDVVSHSPDKARGHFNLGGALISHGRIDEGIGELSIAATVDPAFLPAVKAIVSAVRKDR